MQVTSSSCLLEGLLEFLINRLQALIHQKGQQHQTRQQIAEPVLSMAVIMFEVVSLIVNSTLKTYQMAE
jgi:hypothetical protein